MVENIDFELINRFKEGEEQAFNLLAAKYQKQVYWHARRMVGNHIDADDVTQEVLIVMYKKLKDFRFDSSLSTWLYKVTSTRSINQLRKNKVKRFVFLDDQESMELQGNENLYKSVEDREKLDRLDRVLNQLPHKQRQVFVLRRFDGLSYEEIAEITGKSVGGLKANYFHALKKVTELMENE
ncbi:MAG: RNA polymerase sigma factor [Bacteroidetes bacterium]|nr:RNA polymerase sigma factor [Bacteroidota bacterium]